MAVQVRHQRLVQTLRFIAIFLILVVLKSSAQAQTPTDSLRLMAYNLLNFPDPVPAGRADTLKKIVDFSKPDLLMVCELKTDAGAQSILDRALNAGGTLNFKRAAFVPNGSGGGDIQQSLFYNRNKLELKEQTEHHTTLRDLNQYILWFKDPWLGAHHDTIFLDVYVVHLKAGNTFSDEQWREAMVDSLLHAIEKNGSGRNVVIGGDFNVYSSLEPAYSKLTDVFNAVILKDPLNAPGNWSENFSFQYLHTQSTRTSTIFGDGSGGGMDDRFDFILLSNNMLNGGSPVSYLSDTYAALGNNGDCFNQSILDCNGADVPLSVRKSMYYMSDHLPVLLDVEVDYPDATGLFEEANQSVLQFPAGNVVAEDLVFTIDPASAQYIRVSVFDAGGRLLHSEQQWIPTDLTKWKIKSPQANGIYFLQLMGSSFHATAKFAVEK